MDINSYIESLTPAEIAKVMTAISERGNIRSIDYSHKQRRIAKTELYHSSCPKPHMVDSFETYTHHADSIREQVMSGVE